MNKYYKIQHSHTTHYFCKMHNMGETLVVTNYGNGRWGREVLQDAAVDEVLKAGLQNTLPPLFNTITEDEFTKAADEANKFINPEIEK